MKKIFVLLLLLFFIIFLLYRLVYKHEILSPEEKIESLLEKKLTLSYLENKIHEALNQNKLQDARMYEEFANSRNIVLSPSILSSIKKKNTFLKTSIRETKAFSKGFISGEVESIAGLTGSISSDFLLIGDIRDVYKQGKAYIYKEDYDEFILSISALGLFLSLADISSAGASIPLKVSASVLKTAKKTGNLSKGFIKHLNKTFSKSMNIKLLKKVDFSSIKSMKSSFNNFSKSIKLQKSKKLLLQLKQVKNNTSYLDSIFLLKYVNEKKDLAKLLKVSSKYKNNTKAVFKVLGKSAIKTGKNVIKITGFFLLELFSFLISVISFFFMLFFKSYFNTLKDRFFKSL